MKTAKDIDYFEISLPALIKITKDIVERAFRAGFSADNWKCCVVRLPKEQNENSLRYELDFPEYHI